jgi:MFS family permease
MNFPIFASTMALEFGQQADGFGLLSSVLAVGSLAGALLAARRERARMRLVVGAAGGFGLASLASVVAPTYATYAVTLVLIGFCVVTMLTTANGYVQTTTDPALRGRVLALYVAILLGGTPVGAPVVGWVAAEYGPRVAISVSAVAAFVACGVGVVWTLASGRVHRSSTRRFGLEITETRPIAVVAPVPAEFSDEVAGTTPIPVPPRSDPERSLRPRHG